MTNIEGQNPQAPRRRQAGWVGKLMFMTELNELANRHHVGDETLTAQMMLDGFHAAAKEIREKVPQAKEDFFFSVDEDLEYFVLTLEEMDHAFIENCPDIFDVFDNALSRLYDWCDKYKWWVEPAKYL